MSQIYAEQYETLILKFTYKKKQSSVFHQSSRISSQQTLQIKMNQQVIIDFKQIFKMANKFIEEHVDSMDFLQIYLPTTSWNWVNIYEFMKGTTDKQLTINKVGDKFLLQIQIREFVVNPEEKDSGMMITQWENSLYCLQNKIKQINADMKQKFVKTDQSSYSLVQLAYFYAEPLVELRKNQIKQAEKEVSFQEESNLFIKALRKTKIIRDALIKISVATQKNIEQTLINGVKILHFSCHGVEEEKDKNSNEKQNSLIIEDSECIGMKHKLSSHRLMEIIGRNQLPDIIVFNACYSQNLARKIHEKFPTITTIGHRQKAADRSCEAFAEQFYPNIFRGVDVEQAFKKTQAKLEEKGKKIFIFSQSATKLEPYQFGLNQEKFFEFMDEPEFIEEKIFGHTRLLMYNFIVRYLMDSQRKTVYLKGPSQHGKSLFIKKSLVYLKQRRKKDVNYLIIDLKKGGSQINSMVWLREEFQDKIYEQIRHNQVILVFDHCDSILENQQKQFNTFIKEIKHFSPNSQIIVVATNYENKREVESTYVDFHFADQVQFKDYIFYQTNYQGFRQHNYSTIFSQKNKSKASPIIHQLVSKQVFGQIRKAQNQIQAFKIFQSSYWNKISSRQKQIQIQEKELRLTRFKKYIKLPKEGFSQMKRLSNNFSQQKDSNSSEKKQQYQKLQENMKLSRKLVTEIDSLSEDLLKAINIHYDDVNQDFCYMFPIISIVHFKKKVYIEPPRLKKRESDIMETAEERIDGFLSIFDEEILKQYKLTEQVGQKFYNLFHLIIGVKLLPFITNKVSPNNKTKFIKTYRTLYGLCLTLKKYFSTGFDIFEIKLLLLMECLGINQQLQFESNKEKTKIYSKALNKMHLENGIPQLQEIYKKILNIQNLKYTQELSREQNDKILGFNMIKSYYDLLEELKKLKEEIGSTSEDEEFRGFYGGEELKLMTFPLIALIHAYIHYPGGNFKRDQIKNLEKYLKSLQQFLFQQEKQKQNLFIDQKSYKLTKKIAKNFIEPYIQSLFTLTKFSLANHFSRTEIISDFEKWIKICKKENLKNLQQQIQEEKNLSYSSCVALMSVPLAFKWEKQNKDKTECRILNHNSRKLMLINPYRFQNLVLKMMTETFKDLSKTIFPRMDNLNDQTLVKYMNGNLPILISLFVVDCANNQNSDIVYIENSQGLSQPRRMSEVNLFQSSVNIFCGANILKIKRYIQKLSQKLKKIDQNDKKFGIFSEDCVFIFLDVALEEQRGRGYMKKKCYEAMHDHIRNRKILFEILQTFYSQFCSVMFKEEHNSFIQQTRKAFLVGKAKARISAFHKYGNLCPEIIDEIHSQIKIYFYVKDERLTSPPLKIGNINTKQSRYREKINQYRNEKPSGKASTGLGMQKLQKIVVSDKIEIGFNEEVHQILRIFTNEEKECQKYKSNEIEEDSQDQFYHHSKLPNCVLIDYEQNDKINFKREEYLIESIKIKLRKRGVDIRDRQEFKQNAQQFIKRTAISTIGPRSHSLVGQKFQGVFIFRHFQKEAIFNTLKEINKRYSFGGRQPFRFFIFTHPIHTEGRLVDNQIKQQIEITEIIRPIIIKMKPFSKFNLLSFYFHRKEKSTVAEIQKFFENEGKQIQSNPKREKVLEIELKKIHSVKGNNHHRGK